MRPPPPPAGSARNSRRHAREIHTQNTQLRSEKCPTYKRKMKRKKSNFTTKLWSGPTRGRAKSSVHMPWTVPRAQALLRGRDWVAQLWAKSVGAVRLRALPPFPAAVVE